MAQIITGFHAVEERVRKAIDSGKTEGLVINYSKPGPRIKKILEIAKAANIQILNCSNQTLDSMVINLSDVAKDHRGIVLTVSGDVEKPQNLIEFDQWVLEQKSKNSELKTERLCVGG